MAAPDRNEDNIERLVQNVMEIVQDIDIEDLRAQATHLGGGNDAIDQFMIDLQNAPQVQEEDERDIEEEWQMIQEEWQREKEDYLCNAFSDISPEWLRTQIEDFRKVYGIAEDKFSEKVVQMVQQMKEDNVPTRKDWENKVKEQEELEKWSQEITVDQMIDLYDGNPESHFLGPNREQSELYKKHSRVALWDAFRTIKVNNIDREHKRAKYSFTNAHRALTQLQSKNGNHKTAKPRKDEEIRYPADPCFQFVKEKKFVEFRADIEAEVERRITERREAFKYACMSHTFVECQCCFNKECLDEDMVPCNGGHLYCKECIQQSTNVAMGEGAAIIRCLGQCEEEIPPKQLQKVLNQNVLSKLLVRRRSEEVKISPFIIFS